MEWLPYVEDALKAGTQLIEIAQHIGVTKRRLDQQLSAWRKAGIQLKSKNRVKKWEENLVHIVQWIEEGETAVQIASKLQMKVKVLSRQLNRMKARGIEVPHLEIEKPHRKAVPNKPEKFTGRQKTDEYWETVRANVIQWVSEKVTRKTIAERLGIKESSVSNRIYKWRQEGYPVPYPHPERSKITVEEKKKKNLERQKESRERKRLIRLATKKLKVKISKVSDEPEIKRLPNKQIDMTNLQSVMVDSRTRILVPIDKDPEVAIQEYKKKYNKQ